METNCKAVIEELMKALEKSEDIKAEVATLEYERRLLIALKSPIQSLVDPHHRCEDCGKVLMLHDFHAYWDGCVELERAGAVPRCCVRCAENEE